jgi:O-succinylbenzoate synthase
MKATGVEVLIAPVRLRAPVGSAGLVHHDRAVVFLRLETDQGVGWGECSAYPGARWPDPSVADLEPVVVDRVLDRLRAASPGGVLPLSHRVAEVCRGPSAAPPYAVAEQSVAAAVEMAVLDVELRAAGRSLASWLGASRSEVEVGALVGIPPDRRLSRLLAAADRAVEAGARRLRVKIEPGWSKVPLEALRDRFGGLPLSADANGSYEAWEPDALEELDDLGLVCIEQPFAPTDLEAHRRLGQRLRTPIALDEALWSPGRVEAALALEACRVACLKPGRLGGILAAVEAARACASAGVSCFVGGFFESGLGRATNAAVAGRPEFSLPGDLSDPDSYLVKNPFSYLACEHGLVRLSAAPGIGAEPRPQLLEAVTRRRWVRWES